MFCLAENLDGVKSYLMTFYSLGDGSFDISG